MLDDHGGDQSATRPSDIVPHGLAMSEAREISCKPRMLPLQLQIRHKKINAELMMSRNEAELTTNEKEFILVNLGRI